MNALIFTLLAGLCYGVAWHIQFRPWLWAMPHRSPASEGYGSVTFVRPWWTEWWWKDVSWSNKYKGRDKASGPAFPGSTWILVFLTDAFHFFQMLTLMLGGVAFYHISEIAPLAHAHVNWLTFAVIWSSIFSIGFTVSFRGLSFILNYQHEMEQIKQAWTHFTNWVAILHTKPIRATAFYLLCGLLALFYIVGWDQVIDRYAETDTASEIVGAIWVVIIVGVFWYGVRKRHNKSKTTNSDNS